MINLAEWLKDKFKRKNKIVKESYIHSTFIESCCKKDNNFYYFSSIILFEFTDDKFPDVCEFLDASKLEASKLISTSLDIETGIDKYGEPIYISYPKNYFLIKCTPQQIVDTILNINGLSNQVLKCLKAEIYEHMPRKDFIELERYDILDMNAFKMEEIEETDFTYIKYESNEMLFNCNNILFVSFNNILSKLPKCFTALDVIEFITILMYNESFVTSTDKEWIVFNAHDLKYKKSILAILYNNGIFKYLFNDISMHDILNMLITPVFNRNTDDDNILNGSLSDENIDDIFKQQYDRFNNVTDDNIIYKDIDEIIEDENIKTDEELKEDNKDE